MLDTNKNRNEEKGEEKRSKEKKKKCDDGRVRISD